MSLGSIYEPQHKERGRDLRWELEVPAAAVGDPRGVQVKLPDRLPVKDAPERAPRCIQAQDPKGALVLHLPESFASGSALRLRGYGEPRAGGSAGDLYLVVKLNASMTQALVPTVQSLALRGEAAKPLLWTILALVGAIFATLFVL